MATASIIGLGNMGREHKAVYEAEGIGVIERLTPADFVSIATPDNLHGEQVIKALRRGQIVFCEKPLCTRTGELKLIRELAQPGQLGCNFPLRYLKKFQRLKLLIEAGTLGEIYFVQATYHWGRRGKLDSTWRADTDYSFMLGGGIHMIDLVKFLFPGEMKALGPAIENKSIQIGAIRINQVALCQIVADFGSDRGDHWHKIELRGTKSHISVTNHRQTDKRAALRAFIRGEASPKTPEILDVMECALALAQR